jgi:alpha-N-acetylglucosamine transferase
VLFAANKRLSATKQPQRLAVVQFVDASDEYLWGVYSTHVQLKKFNMTPTVDHIAMVSQDISDSSRSLLSDWLGANAIVEFDRNYILKRLTGDETLRQGVFLKLQAFNLTRYDKIILLDNDLLVRRSIMHWFDYPAPAATGSRGMMEFNSGAMVIEPRTSLFDTMMEVLPLTKRWNIRGGYKGTDDPWNSLGGQQGFMSAFFASNVTDDTIFTMPYGHSILSSDLDDRPENAYYWRHRPEVFETVHFTKHKPWKKNKKTNNVVTCAMLREWKESVKEAPADRLPKLGDVLQDCPPLIEESKVE